MHRDRSTGAGPANVAQRVAGLRAAALGAIVLLLIEYALGEWVNLEENVPSADRASSLWGAFASAVVNGPVSLALHALLGTLLIAAAIAVAVRAIHAERRLWSVLAGIGLVSVLFAWVAGDVFVTTGEAGPSLLMALLTGVALLCYALLLFSVVSGE
jgi:hypothetical protein